MVEHAFTHHKHPPLTLKRLGLRVIRGDREAALVLGDAMQERRIDHILTGRVRPIRFMVTILGSAEERKAPYASKGRSVISEPPTARVVNIPVRGVEVLYNVHTYHARKNPDGWGDIWRMWMTKKADIYRALLRYKILGSSLGFQNIAWVEDYSGIGRTCKGERPDLHYILFLRSPEPRRRRRFVARTHLLNLNSDERQSVTLDETGGIERDMRRRKTRS
jgi:hypothetical protein